MHKILDSYEQREISPEDVERSIQFHMEALEGLPYQRIKDADLLCYRLVTSHMIDGEEEFIDPETVADILVQFRVFLTALPGGVTA